MSRYEVSKKLDEIVDFAGVERYLDTPVKRYSSGMMVRLGFAVAAHLEPDILIVDEVLAVGDAEFQKKAIGKMKEVSEGHGRTILFVSHNMGAIQNLCEEVIIIEKGKEKFKGNTTEGIDLYLHSGKTFKGYSDLKKRECEAWKCKHSFSNLISIETLNKKMERQSSFQMDTPLQVKVVFELLENRKNIELGLFIRDPKQSINGLLFSPFNKFHDFQKGINEIIIEIPKLNLLPNTYSLGLWIVHQRRVDSACDNAVNINVISNSDSDSFIDYDRFKGYGNLISCKWAKIN